MKIFQPKHKQTVEITQIRKERCRGEIGRALLKETHPQRQALSADWLLPEGFNSLN